MGWLGFGWVASPGEGEISRVVDKWTWTKERVRVRVRARTRTRKFAVGDFEKKINK